MCENDLAFQNTSASICHKVPLSRERLLMNPPFTLPAKLSPLACRQVANQAWCPATTGEPLLNSARDIAESWLNAVISAATMP